MVETPVDVIARHLDRLPHPDAGLIRLVQFSHDSPGLRRMRRQIAEAIVALLESNGYAVVPQHDSSQPQDNLDAGDTPCE